MKEKWKGKRLTELLKDKDFLNATEEEIKEVANDSVLCKFINEDVEIILKESDESIKRTKELIKSTKELIKSTEELLKESKQRRIEMNLEWDRFCKKCEKIFEGKNFYDA
ncbi:hypothetical protein SGLAD_v1c06290 [Spiroplasma gladiatoris]|uniref:Uncharacterized protein n=1 Tax=Spiroplasma gladiatoris TaxID=2143 RepID=A0A4P7AJ65_9MOLU|nr:hypothetical protein [Spiroplasma gladiatoris]QBQ07828.1 hypothetical protein SGLAD_v1c06290 [Spiroplasma gladiatoris]